MKIKSEGMRRKCGKFWLCTVLQSAKTRELLWTIVADNNVWTSFTMFQRHRKISDAESWLNTDPSESWIEKNVRKIKSYYCRARGDVTCHTKKLSFRDVQDLDESVSVLPIFRCQTIPIIQKTCLFCRTYWKARGIHLCVLLKTLWLDCL